MNTSGAPSEGESLDGAGGSVMSVDNPLRACHFDDESRC